MLAIYANIRNTAPGNVRREYRGLILYFRTPLTAIPIVIIIKEEIFRRVASEHVGSFVSSSYFLLMYLLIVRL